VSSAAWNAGNAGHYANPEVDVLLDQARDAVDEETYQAALSQVQQIVTRDDPAAIYVLQPQWPTVLRRDVVGFVPDLVANGLYDFYRLSRRA
jgi:ABC-type transport system substrate-binding protein